MRFICSDWLWFCGTPFSSFSVDRQIACRIKPGEDMVLWVHTHSLILACSSTTLGGVLILPLLSNEIYWPSQEQWGATLVQDNIIYWEEEMRDCLCCPHNIWKTCNCCLPCQRRDKRGQIHPSNKYIHVSKPLLETCRMIYLKLKKKTIMLTIGKSKGLVTTSSFQHADYET